MGGPGPGSSSRSPNGSAREKQKVTGWQSFWYCALLELGIKNRNELSSHQQVTDDQTAKRYEQK